MGLSMASNKNQHFVPKVYLRPFSCDEHQASINLFNLRSRRTISNASIKGQCSSNYFYGDSEKLDRALQNSEGLYGALLQELLGKDFRLEERHKQLLRHFSLLQHIRTEAQMHRNLQFMTGMATAAFDGSPPPEYIPSAKEAVLIALRIFADSMSLVYDLKVRLVRNRTGTAFVTSDNPSVHTNRWHIQSPKAHGKAPGISSAGVAFFMPLTPQYLCVVYDGDVYTMDHEHGWVNIERADDVVSINEQQFLNCHANVYFSDWASRHVVEQSFHHVANRRPPKRHEVTVAVLESENSWGQEFRVVPQEQIRNHTEGIVHVKEVLPEPSRWPSFFRLRNKPRIYSNNTGTGFVRAWSLQQGRYSGVGYKKIR
jgi:hypothetical protein